MRPMDGKPTRFGTNVLKLSIGSTDDINLEVVAQYNPGQLDLQRTVEWKRSGNRKDNRPDHRRYPAPDNDVEYTGGDGRTLTLELLFDGLETNTCVEPQIEKLDMMATLREHGSKDPDPRPHQCVIVWGSKGIKPLVCVIESIGVKYSMFDCDGNPLRALATVKVKEASVSAFDRPSAFQDQRMGNASASRTR
jgi:Contractile injection system tube protein